MKIGFTGTRGGMTPRQREVVCELLLKHWHEAVNCGSAHHGDCVGADSEFHDICLLYEVPVIGHPCDILSHRARRTGFIAIRKEKPALERNRDIVGECDLLIAAPKGPTEEQRSGTWATVRYARRVNRPIVIVFPDGSVSAEK